jgi:hypothetical protein
MRAYSRWYVSVAALAVLGGAALMPASEPSDKADGPAKAGKKADAEQIKPRWQTGQKWEVETLNQLSQYGGKRKQEPKQKAVLWEFQVLPSEKLGDKKCYRLQVQAKVGTRQQPLTVLWLDEKSLALRQVQTQMRVQGTLRTITESYESASGQPTPIMTPLTAIPLDMPVFLDGGKAALSKFSYEAFSGEAGKKDANDVGFAFDIEQRMDPVGGDTIKELQSKGLLAESFTKELAAKPFVEVRLKAAGRQVRQLWQPGLPWPAYSSNGVAQAHLVRVIPAKP